MIPAFALILQVYLLSPTPSSGFALKKVLRYTSLLSYEVLRFAHVLLRNAR